MKAMLPFRARVVTVKQGRKERAVLECSECGGQATRVMLASEVDHLLTCPAIKKEQERLAHLVLSQEQRRECDADDGPALGNPPEEEQNNDAHT